MKKSVVSLALCLSVLLGMMSVTFALPICAMTDDTEVVDLNTRGDQSAAVWGTRLNLIDGDYTTVPVTNSDATVTEHNDGSVTYGNTNGLWPSVVYMFDTPVTVNADAALDLDFTVQPDCATTIYLYFGPSDPLDFDEGTYVWVSGPDLSEGHYQGVLFLEDAIRDIIYDTTVADQCYDANGDLVITGVKIFATSFGGAAPEAVTVNKLHLVADQDTSATTTTSGKTEPVHGDLNGDGVSDLSDAAQLFFHVNGTAALTGEDLLPADLNGDGSVNLTDMTRLFYIINGQL